MLKNQKYNTAQHFEGLFKILSSKRFLNKDGLGGDLPFFIHSFPINKQSEIDSNIISLKKRLQNESIETFEVNLFELCVDILKRENLFEQIIGQEMKLPKQRLMRVLSGPLNIDSMIIPEINSRLQRVSAKIVFITGIGAVFPFIRTHTIINNFQTLDKDLPLVMFFPGTYNNQTLNLFDLLKDANDYRAHNLNEYKI